MSKRQKTDKQLFIGLAKEFHELVGSKQSLRTSAENFLNNVIDELTLGIIFDQHRKYKTNAYDLEVDENTDEVYTDLDPIQHKMKKTLNCICPACKKEWPADKSFARHLRTCMGLGGRQSRSCNVAKQLASNSKERENPSSYGTTVSDDDDDPDWGSGEQRKKKKEKNRNRNSRGNLFYSILWHSTH